MATDTSVAGLAIYGGLFGPALLAKLVAKGVIDRQEAADLLDEMIRAIETGYRAPNAPPPAALDFVRSSLEAQLARYSATPHQGSGDGGRKA